MAQPISYGKVDEKGIPTQQPKTCALTGQRLVDGWVTHQVPDTPYFYGLTPSAHRRITAKQVADIEQRIVTRTDADTKAAIKQVSDEKAGAGRKPPKTKDSDTPAEGS